MEPIIEALKAAGWTVKLSQAAELYAIRSARYWNEPDAIEVWQDDDDSEYTALLGDDRDSQPCAEGETPEEAFWALMALPYGSTTVGTLCGVAAP